MKLQSVFFIFGLGCLMALMSGCSTSVPFKPDPGLIQPVDGQARTVNIMAGYFPAENESDGTKMTLNCHRQHGGYVYQFMTTITKTIQDFIREPSDRETCDFYYVTIDDAVNSFNAQVKAAYSQRSTDPVQKKPATPVAAPGSTADSGGTASATEADPDVRVAIRNQYASFLLSMEDYNCQSYLHAAFTNKAVTDTERDFLQSLGTGGAAGTAITNGYLSAGIGITNLVYGAAIDSEDSHIYLKETIQAILGAIDASKSATKNEIDSNLKQSYDDYPIFSLLSDIKNYESACSLRTGVFSLQKLASNATQNQQEAANLKSSASSLAQQVVDLQSNLNEIKQRAFYASSLAGQSAALKAALDSLSNTAAATLPDLKNLSMTVQGVQSSAAQVSSNTKLVSPAAGTPLTTTAPPTQGIDTTAPAARGTGGSGGGSAQPQPPVQQSPNP